MSRYTIRLRGCDDSTSFDVELTDAEARTAVHIAAMSQRASEFDCQPTMIVTPADKENSPS